MQYECHELISFKVKQRKKLSLGNIIAHHLEFERCTFTFIIYWEPQPFMGGDCRYGCGLNYFLIYVEDDLF